MPARYRITFAIERIDVEILANNHGTKETITEERRVDELADIVAAYKCRECEAVRAECVEEAVYECGECGREFVKSQGGGKNGNLCPDCGNKFGTRVGDQVCAECEESGVDAIEGVVCPFCEDALAVEDFAQHLIDDHSGEIMGD